MIDISVENREEYIKALDSGDSANLTRFIYGQLEKYVDSLFKDFDGMILQIGGCHQKSKKCLRLNKVKKVIFA